MSESGKQKAEIIYIFDGYCGWCWGFSDVILRLARDFSDRFVFSALSGGLITGSRIGPLGDFSAYIERAIPRVEATTGIIFTDAYRTRIRDRSTIQDSRVPAAAYAVIRRQKPDINQVELAHAILSVNFAEGLDVSKPESFAKLFRDHGLDAESFAAQQRAGTLHPTAEEQFRAARDNYGIEAFPALAYGRDGQFFPLVSGYRSYDVLAPALDILHREPPSLESA